MNLVLRVLKSSSTDPRSDPSLPKKIKPNKINVFRNIIVFKNMAPTRLGFVNLVKDIFLVRVEHELKSYILYLTRFFMRVNGSEFEFR